MIANGNDILSGLFSWVVERKKRVLEEMLGGDSEPSPACQSVLAGRLSDQCGVKLLKY